MLTGCGDQTSEEKIGTFTANFTCNDRHVWVIKTSVYVYIYIYFISHFHRICKVLDAHLVLFGVLYTS